MKIYVHYERGPHHTFIFKCPSDAFTVKDVIRAFVANFNSQHGKRKYLEIDDIGLSIGLSQDHLFNGNSDTVLSRLVDDLADVFVVDAPPKSNTTPITHRSAKSPLNGERKSSSQLISDSGRDPGNTSGVLRNALDIKRQGNYRKALMILQEIIRVDPGNLTATLELSDLCMEIKNLGSTILPLLESRINHPEFKGSGEFWLMLGRAYARQENYSGSIGAFQQAITLFESQGRNTERVAEQYRNTRQGHLHALTHLGQAHYEGGDKRLGLDTLNRVVQTDDRFLPGLIAYGKVAISLRNYDVALSVFKIAVLQDNTHPVARECLAQAILATGTYKFIESLGPVTEASRIGIGQALSFIAGIVKESGGVLEGIEMYKRALECEPANPGYALSLAHAIELTYDYEGAFSIIKTFLRTNPNLSIGSIITAAEIMRYIEPVNCCVHYVRSESPVLTHWCAPGGKAMNGTETDDLSTDARPLAPYSRSELDLCALVCTLCKIMYVVGQLEVLPELVRLVELARRGRELHQTAIRNEMAYCGCVGRLLPYHHGPPTQPTGSPLYFAGDSHALPPAWQTIVWNEESHMIVPRLVTGLKLWHLRPESKFFPKHNFWNTMRTIPDNADVIFAFGEIDCREGIPKAVDKCRYDTVDEACQVLVDIYLNTLDVLRKERKFNIFIHPIVPVLDVTRHVVQVSGISRRQAPVVPFQQCKLTVLCNTGPHARAAHGIPPQRIPLFGFFRQTPR